MTVYIGADHRGFRLKEAVKKWLLGQGIDLQDLGSKTYDSQDDYVYYAYRVAKQVKNDLKENKKTVGIVICGSGVGVEVVAGKEKGIRCGLGFSVPQVKAARSDDDITVLALAADFMSTLLAKKLIKAFLETPFSKKERHVRRIRKIEELDYYV